MSETIGKIAILGNGSWGTALAKILTDNGHTIKWWIRSQEAITHLEEQHHNPNYLTSVYFKPESIRASTNLAEVVDACDTIIVAVPSAFAQPLIDSIPAAVWRTKQVISAIKGIMPDCNMLLNDYMEEAFGLEQQQYAAITGPCHAEEVANERLSYLTFSGLNDELANGLARAFANRYIYTTSNHDIWGVQFAAVLKNIYAIGAGVAHSLDYGDNFLSVYTTNCYREMYGFLVQHFNKVHPSNEMPDFHTSAYLGDLLVTCYSLHSRNRTFGAMIGKGYTVQAATLEMNMVAEGYYGARGMMAISQQFDIAVPIASYIYNILWKKKQPAKCFRELQRMLS